MRVVDLTNAAASWLLADAPAAAFTNWLVGMPQEIHVGFSGLGGRPNARPRNVEWIRLVDGALTDDASYPWGLRPYPFP